MAKSRGQKVITELFPNGFKNAIIGTDRWVAQLNTLAKRHQLCLAHLLRDLVYLIETKKSSFAKQIKELFLEAINLKKQKLSPLRQVYFCQKSRRIQILKTEFTHCK